jgi:alpha-galactosidase
MELNMNKKFLPLFAAVIYAITLGSSTVLALQDGLARTPPMGFNTWNYFGCRNPQRKVDETSMKQIADAFLSKGMKDVGYEFVNIDDCWASGSRDSRGGLAADPQFFPKGMREIGDYIHSKGLKFGLYTDVGTSTCATCYGTGGLPGMINHEQQDADTFVAWGVDYLKVDFCCHDNRAAVQQYVKVRDCLKNAVTRMKSKVPDAHPIVYSICNWGEQNPWQWGDSVGHLWRTTKDISNQYGSQMSNLDNNTPLYPYARIGAWNDPDMLEVGYGDFATNYARARAHFSLWCMSAAPLIAGNDIRFMSTQIQEILINKDAIGINQDTLGGDTTRGIIQGRKVASGNTELWVKLLKGRKNSDYAIMLFNRNNANATTISITTDQIRTVGGDIAAGKAYKVRDVWGKKDLPDWTAGGTFTSPAPVGVNDVFMARLSLVPPIALAPIATVKVNDKKVQSEGEQVIVNLQKAGPSAIRIVNLNGKVVYSKTLAGLQNHTISTRGFSRGLYVVNVQNASERFEEKIFLK